MPKLAYSHEPSIICQYMVCCFLQRFSRKSARLDMI